MNVRIGDVPDLQSSFLIICKRCMSTNVVITLTENTWESYYRLECNDCHESITLLTVSLLSEEEM